MLLSSEGILHSDALKVGHHGSITSSTQPFVEAVKPEHAIISVGAHNRFGHPSDIVIQRFQEVDAMIHRTDKDRAAVFQTNGITLKKIDW